MKKFYSIVLMACAMLVSANIWAVDVTTRQQIQDAINGASEGQTVNILLKNNIDVDAVIVINAGQTVNVNLNEKSMTAAGQGVFELRKGTLNITGTGSIEKTAYSPQTDAIRVYGSVEPTDANWSNLLIDENVTMNVAGPQKYDNTKKMNVETTNAITVMEQGTSPATKKAAYGVNIEIKGKVYGSKYGVKINGNVTQKVIGTEPGNEYNNLPYVHVASTAEVYAAPQTGNAVAIYSSGVGRFLIEGYVHGASGVYVKAGSVEMNDAVVKSDYTGDYKDPVAKGSGVSAGGSAITIDSNKSYGGGQEVTIKGDTKVEGGTGYAIEEVITKGTEGMVSSVKVEGGTIEGSAAGQGAIVFTENTTNSDAEIIIVGGNLENNVQIKDNAGNVTTATVEEFLPKDDEGKTVENYYTTAVTGEDGKTTIVVTYFDDANDKPVVSVTPNSVVAAADDASVVWVSDADTEETLQDNKVLAYLEATDGTHNQTLNVGDATHKVTLTIGRVILGPKAKIAVAAGSKLIINGTQGIVADLASNIELSTEEGNPSIFLFNPAVISNRHPKATVKYTSKAYMKDNGDFIYQFFTSPFTAVESIVASSSTYQTDIQVWNVKNYDRIGVINNAGYPIDYSKFSKKFGFYSMTTNNPEDAKQTYTMTGEMVGNENAELPLYAEWNGMANAYMGIMDIKAIENANVARKANGSNVAKYIYTYKQVGNSLVWGANNPLQPATYRTQLNPLEPFMMYNGGEGENLVHNYADLVWTPATSPAAAPARRNVPADMTKATIRVNGADGIYDLLTVAESDEFTSGNDEFDSPKYMNDEVNFYVMGDQKMNVLATNDVENTYLGFSCVKGGEFTLSFENVEGNGLTLIDLTTNAAINMTEGATYTFNAAANEVNDYRFKVVNRRNAATAVDTVEAAAKAAGIYTLTGMYLGEMNVWNTLPAGVYVVNGEKRVK